MGDAKVEISSAGYEVISSGTVMTYGDDGDITLHVQLDGFDFNVVLKFERKGNGDKHDLQSATNGNTITFTCINFNGALGTGTRNPIEIGAFRSRRIWINFWVSRCGGEEGAAQRQVVYSLYLESE